MLISIITPVFNGKKYLAEAINSVLEQGCHNVEHIIVDGASTDGTVNILENFGRRFPGRIRYVTRPDKGPCQALNTGWEMAKGDIFGWLGSDDLYTSDALGMVIEYFSRNPDAQFVYGECDLIDDAGQWIGRFATRDFKLDEAINKGVYIPFPAAFYRRALVRKIGGMRQGDDACDTDFIIRAGQHYDLQRTDMTLARFRLHTGGKTGGWGNSVYPRALYLINRRYGGNFLSPICMRYYRFLLRRLVPIGIFQRLLARNQNGYQHRGFRRVVIFGAAYSGALCFHYLTQNGIEVIGFLDNHPSASLQYCGLPVFKPGAGLAVLSKEIDGIVIASSSSHREMKRQIRKLGFQKAIAFYSPDQIKSIDGCMDGTRKENEIRMRA